MGYPLVGVVADAGTSGAGASSAACAGDALASGAVFSAGLASGEVGSAALAALAGSALSPEEALAVSSALAGSLSCFSA